MTENDTDATLLHYVFGSQGLYTKSYTPTVKVRGAKKQHYFFIYFFFTSVPKLAGEKPNPGPLTNQNDVGK